MRSEKIEEGPGFSREEVFSERSFFWHPHDLVDIFRLQKRKDVRTPFEPHSWFCGSQTLPP